MRFTAVLLLAPAMATAAPGGVCMNADCGCGPNYKASWCTAESTNGEYCSHDDKTCVGCGGAWCGSSGPATAPAVSAAKHVCMNADCGCGPKYHAAWCGPQHTNGDWCSVSADRCSNECRGGVWCGAAKAPHHDHDHDDHHAVHEEMHHDRKKLAAEKQLLDKTKVHLAAEKKIWKDGKKQLNAQRDAWRSATKELNAEKKEMKKDKVWKKEKGQWFEDKDELKEDRKEWKKDNKAWKGERDEWREDNKEYKKDKKEWKNELKDWKVDHKDFHKGHKDDHKEIMGERKELGKDMRAVNKEIRQHNKDRKFLKKKGLWKEEKAEWKQDKKQLVKEKKALKSDIAEWKDGHDEWHTDHDSHMHKKKWHGKAADYWKESHDVSGDPFVVDQSGKKVQFFLRTDQEELLLRCGAMQMYGRTMGTDIAGDHQQWFDRMRFVIGNQEQLLVGVNKGAAQVGLEQDGIDVIAPNASHKHDSSVGQVVQKPLNILQVMVEGAKMSTTGAVATDSALIAIWSGTTGETVQFSDGNTVIQVKSAIAQKFTEKNEQKMYTHLDLRFMEVKTSECSAGLLAEIWGFAPMSEKTAAMLQPPQ